MCVCVCVCVTQVDPYDEFANQSESDMSGESEPISDDIDMEAEFPDIIDVSVCVCVCDMCDICDVYDLVSVCLPCIRAAPDCVLMSVPCVYLWVISVFREEAAGHG